LKVDGSMIAYALAALMLVPGGPFPYRDNPTSVCGRTMRFEDQYCAAKMSGQAWTHAEAAMAHERFAPFVAPKNVAAIYLAAANNWMMAGEPEKALVDFNRALASGLPPYEQESVRLARDHAARVMRRR
jgi:hypothetical protein